MVATNEEVTMEDVYNEVNEILVKNRVTEFRNRPASKKYAFELTDVPRECDYLEVLYPFSSLHPPLSFVNLRTAITQ
jgi:DNA polymerase alpha subunit A